MFYGEFDDTQPEVFFSSLANFVVDFERARKDNEESRARSKKKKQKPIPAEVFLEAASEWRALG